MSTARHSLHPGGWLRRVMTFCMALTAAAGLLSGARADYANPDGVAVVIGNRTYAEGIPEVNFAHRDADAFRHYVVEVLGFDPENVIDLRDATQAQMWSTFGSRASADRSDLWAYLDPAGSSDVVVYHSGHGAPGIEDKRGYLLPVDADPNTAELNGYPIDVLYRNLSGLDEARSVTVFVDACFSGGSGGGMLIDSASPVYVTPAMPETAGERLAVLTAATGKQLASWDREAGHGLFTHHLLDALHGAGDANADGEVTAREAKAYLDRHMTRAARRTFKRRQNASLVGNADTVLASARVVGGFPARPELEVDNGTGDAGAEMDPVTPPIQTDAPKRRWPTGKFRDCPKCPEMVVVPAGSYEMGTPSSESDRHGYAGWFDNQKPLHQVTITEPFAVGVHEVTRGEWSRFVSETEYSVGDSCMTFEDGVLGERSGRSWHNPGHSQTDDAYPVVCVSWEDARAYVEWLSERTGEDYRLLSESEWEYVARAGTRTARHWGEEASGQCRHANGADYGTVSRWGINGMLCDDRYLWTAPVGSYTGNGYGLYDVLGNVQEWTMDCQNDSYVGAPEDESAWKVGDCSRRVLRGGGWSSPSRNLRSAARTFGSSNLRSDDTGFRIAKTLHPRLTEDPLSPEGIKQILLTRKFPSECQKSCQMIIQNDQEPFTLHYQKKKGIQSDLLQLDHDTFELDIGWGDGGTPQWDYNNPGIFPFFLLQYENGHKDRSSKSSRSLYTILSSEGMMTEYFHYFLRNRGKFYYLGEFIELSYDRKMDLFVSRRPSGSGRFITSIYRFKGNELILVDLDRLKFENVERE